MTQDKRIKPEADKRTAIVNLRLTPAELARLKDRHAKTFAEHRLQFAPWLLAQVLER